MNTHISPRQPTSRDAALVVRETLGVAAISVERMTTGNCHYVYAVTTADGRRVVVRMASDESRDELAGGVYWHERLRAVGVPLAALLGANLTPTHGFPSMLLERLPGSDLASVYTSLSAAQLHTLAKQIIAIQLRVGSLPPAQGYGFARSYDDPNLYATWLDVTLASVRRSQRRIASAGVAPLRHVERVRACLLGIADYLRAVPPTAFLDDTTTKNVLIHNGELSGIVDTDAVCFGDPLFTLALTRVALLAHALDPSYADDWANQLRLDADQGQALAAYCAVFCLDFMGELGQRFNRDTPEPVDMGYLRRLEAMLDEALGEV